MKVYNQPRGSGKTTRLIYESAMKQIPILCTDWLRAGFIKESAKEMGLSIPEPISADYLMFEDRDEFGNNVRPAQIRKATKNGVLIDEALTIFKMFLQDSGVCTDNIDSVTLTYPEE